MGKSKNQNRSEVEFLRGQVKRLTKRLKQSVKHNRDTSSLEELLKEFPDESPVIETKIICQECKDGEIKLVLSMDTKDIFCCSECSYRKIIKK